MDKQQMFSAFNMQEINDNREKFKKEVKDRWGSTDAYIESSKRTQKYTEKDWKVIMADADKIYKELASNMNLEPSNSVVQELIEKWRQHITKFYYNCTKEILASLGESYVDDVRFTKNIDKYGDGLSVFFRSAIRIYCS